MQIAFGRVRRETAPTGLGKPPFRFDLAVFNRARSKTLYKRANEKQEGALAKRAIKTIVLA